MPRPDSGDGYVYASYGSLKYLRHAVASVSTLRRYDQGRPVALFCSEEHQEILSQTDYSTLFQLIELLPERNRSIVGFKHRLHEFMPFESNLFLDSDTVWCRNPDLLWQQLKPFPFTATGHELADPFFGSSKGFGVLSDVLLDRRRKTLRKFGLTHLPRIQSGMMYAQDPKITEQVCLRAQDMLNRRPETHFRSRLDEGRSEESCEWSLAMAMSELRIHVFPWFQGLNSPQLDFIEGLTDYEPGFHRVKCRYYCDRFMNSLRGIPDDRLRRAVTGVASRLPGRGDYIDVTPFVLHFGWKHQKEPFLRFADQCWEKGLTPIDQHLNRISNG